MPELKVVETGSLYIGIPLTMVLNNFLDTIESRQRDLLEKIGRETCERKLIGRASTTLTTLKAIGI